MTDSTQKNSIYCSLAFGSASVNSYGEYIPCCNVRMDKWPMYKDMNTSKAQHILSLRPQDRINAPNLKSIRQTLMQGEWPEACYNCKESEDAGVGSMRNIWNRSISEAEAPMTEYVNPASIRYLDLTFSTKCNSKCMTCNPNLSDFWEQEHNKIWNIEQEYQTHYKRTCIDKTNTKKIVEDFPNIRRVAFIGGEPTISDEHFEFLKLLISEGKSKDVALSYVTNLTGMTEELKSLWKNFKEVGVSVSIDGYKEVNEYIRYPLKWAKCETNLRKFLSTVQESWNNQGTGETQFGIGLSCTVSTFNAIQCMDLFDFWFDLLLEYNIDDDRTLVGVVGSFVNRVTQPDYTVIGLLSKEYRQEGINKGKALLKKIDEYVLNNPHDPVNLGFIESIKLVIFWLENDIEIKDSNIISNNRHLITESDQYRNRSLENYIPELWEEVQKVWNNRFAQ